ncbi:MAG: TnpV protein [Clostridia bacterium]|nr:TnpV protein [Clostridia bacterium]
MKAIMENNTNIQYRQVGDYNIPNLILPPEEVNIRLGKWGMLHKDYLMNHKKVVFATLLVEGKLWQYLVDIDAQAQQMFDTLIEQMKKAEGITEQLKEENQMEWVCRMENTEAMAREIISSSVNI